MKLSKKWTKNKISRKSKKKIEVKMLNAHSICTCSVLVSVCGPGGLGDSPGIPKLGQAVVWRLTTIINTTY